MTTFAELQSRLNEARKQRLSNEVLILSTIVGNLKSNAKMVNGEKVVTDADVTAYIKKHVKNLEETLSHREVEDTRKELDFVSAFLPTQLSEAQLATIWDTNQPSNMGEYMKLLKENYAGQYDGKLASQIASAKLKGN